MKVKEKDMVTDTNTTVTIASVHKSHTLSPEFSTRAKEKLAKVCKKFRIHKIELYCDVDQYHHQIKAKIHLPMNHIQTLVAESKSLYKTIDLIVCKIHNHSSHYMGKVSHVSHKNLGNGN